MPDAQQSKVIRCNDFTPGIAVDVGEKWAPGQAQLTNTYRCRAKPSGALIGAPRQEATYNGTAFEGTTPTGTPGYRVVGIIVTGPLIAATGTGTADNFEALVAVEYGVPTGSHKHLKVELWRFYEATIPRVVVIDHDTAGVSAGGLATVYGMSLHETRMNRAAPTSPGTPVVIGSWRSPSAADDVTFEFPTDAAPNTDAAYIMATSSGISVTHQGRAIVGVQTDYPHGANGIWATTEDVEFTPVNDPTSFSSPQQYYPERTDGYIAMASMSANELFLLKQSGALVIAGDIANPTVINLPMTTGGGASQHVPARARPGLIYLNDASGIWLWAHGDASQHLTPNIPASNFLIAGSPFSGIRYQYYAESNLVFVSNNWLYDTDTSSWWQIDNQATLQIRYWTGTLNGVFGAVTSYTNAALTFLYRYNVNLNALDYSWQSHPLIETVDRNVDAQAITLRVKGTGTVAVTVTAQSGTTKTITFTFADNSYPHLQRQNLGVQGENLTVRIVSTGTGGNEAPTVYEYNIEYVESQMVPSAA